MVDKRLNINQFTYNREVLTNKNWVMKWLGWEEGFCKLQHVLR